MKKTFISFKLTFLALVLLTGTILAQQSELLLFSEEELVITAARYKQKISEAPSAITVITDEDIHQSGATNIPDILRMVPGLDVMFITASHASVSARGLNSRLANKMLVLIDGRPSYLKLLGNVFWESFSIPLEEIKRIEVIRGPGSALYGANAYNGVIHIITKSPEELEGSSISLTAGNYNTYLGSLIQAGVVDELDYKVSLGWYQTDQWIEEKKNSKGVPRGNISIGYKLKDTSKITLSGGHGRIEGEMAAGSFPMEKEGAMSYLQLNYDLKDLKLLTYWEGVDGETLDKQILTKDKQHTDTYEVEMQHSLDLFKKHSIIWGGNWRHCAAESDMIKEEKKQSTWALYLQEEFKPMDFLSLVAGGRYDYHPLFGEHATPRGSVVYSPIENHSFRISAATAFRSPTFFELYLDTKSSVDVSALPFPVDVAIQGDEDLKPEKITAYEIGYQTFLMERIKGRIDLFYNVYKDFISAELKEMYAANELFPGSPGGLIPKSYIYKNRGKADGQGGEVGFEFLLAEWLTGILNYSYEEIFDREDDPTTFVDEKNQRKKESPQNKVNAGLRFKFKNGLSSNILAHYVDEIEWRDGQTCYKLDPYTLVNVRVGYQLNSHIEIAIAVFNLFNDKHYEYMIGNNPDLPFGEEIARKITGNINCRF